MTGPAYENGCGARYNGTGNLDRTFTLKPS